MSPEMILIVKIQNCDSSTQCLSSETTYETFFFAVRKPPAVSEVLQQTLEVRFAIGKQGESMSQEIQCEELSNDWLENPPSHRIHVWYVHLHLVDFHGKCR